MKIRIIPAVFGFAFFAQASGWAQPSMQSNPPQSKKKPAVEAPMEEAPPEEEQQTLPVKPSRPARGTRRSGGKKVASVADKEAIESYLQGRLGQLSKAHRAQENFGRKFNNSWDGFWLKLFKERKLFEVRIARQRLDLFESLGSLDPASHAAAIADYERLQSNVMKSFEDAQKQKMAEFFNSMSTELRDFSVDQEKLRQDFMAQAQDAWQSQKAGAP